MLAEPPIPLASQQVLLVENGWKASRDGLEAEFLDLERVKPSTLGNTRMLLRL